MAERTTKLSSTVEIIQALFDSGVASISEESTTLLSMWRMLSDSQKLKYFASLYSDTANLNESKDAS